MSDNISINIQRLSLKAKLFRGLADTTRLSILESLRRGEKTTSEIVKETNQNQSNISNHLSCLLDCGLVRNRREGKNVFYDLNNERITRLLEESDSVLTEIVNGLYNCVNYNNESLVDVQDKKKSKN
ncbi:MAG: metalloregulator ArsR/SmtB family transcription factor [Candidatus Nitrosocosmicus sp.]|nr:metalloregulator ArsR/SmtB family transcription factor [Candidatus Nitrosocosmicus sp.]